MKLALFLLLAVSARTALPDLNIDTEAVAPKRFLAAKGHKALLEGYGSQSLEGWIYPFQIFDNFRVSFEKNSGGRIPGASLLRRIIYHPQSLTRVYAAQDFTVEETLFVPVDEPGILISYKVHGGSPVEITAEFHPVLDLMWPAGMGGQDASWLPSLNAFQLAETTGRFHGLIGSPETIRHSDANQYREPWNPQRTLTLTMRTAETAKLAIALQMEGHYNGEAAFKKLLNDTGPLLEEAKAHYERLQNSLLSLQTPDERVNGAFAWAEIAMEQALACNPDLGCGLVGGYGPSRDTRRPQYAWFFAGDGLTVLDGLVAVGERALLDDEYRFLSRYQNSKTGMMWHEISQSAPFLDWFGKLPYAFAHVDISPQYLSQFRRTLDWTGDKNLLRRQWPSLQSAYRYSASLVSGGDGLPRIPADKSGANEQNRLSEELSLATAWTSAAEAYSEMAELEGEPDASKEAREWASRARASLPRRYWNEQTKYFITGFLQDGSPLPQIMSSPVETILQKTFPNRYNEAALNFLSAPSFLTDWGIRSIPANDEHFEAASYAGGSVWPVGTGVAARAFFENHRPLIAIPLWRSLVEESFTDSPGHVDEVYSGNSFRELDVSVPEQSWSSSALVTATLLGVLGIEPDALNHKVTIAPHLPPSWNWVAVDRLQIGETTLGFRLQRSLTQTKLEITVKGPPITLIFEPEIPLGSADLRATKDGQALPVKQLSNTQDSHAHMELSVSGKVRVAVHYAGGVTPEVDWQPPAIGEASRNLRIRRAAWSGQTYTADVAIAQQGGTILEKSPELFALRLPGNSTSCDGTPGNYHDIHLELRFAPSQNASR
jgi:glycogen debranching enzyme